MDATWSGNTDRRSSARARYRAASSVSPSAPSAVAASQRNGTPSTSSASVSAVFSAVATQRSVLSTSPRRAATSARPHAAAAIEPGIVVHVPDVGDPDEPSVGALEAVGVVEHEPLAQHRPGPLGVGQVGRRQELAELRQRLVVAAELDEHAHREVAPARPGPGVLAASLPRRRGDAVALGGALEVGPGVGRRRALGEDLVGAGVGVLLADAEIDERLLGGAHRVLVPALGQAGAGGLDLGPPAQPRLARRRPGRRRGRCRPPRRRRGRSSAWPRRAAAAAPARAR